ncbi:MAG: DUF1861 family protein [Candidatus Latescibacterota bacterium]
MVELHERLEPVAARVQLEELRRRGMPSGGEIVRVAGLPDAMVTNPSIPFRCGGRTVLAVRAAPGGEQPHSRTVFCTSDADGVWWPIPGAPELPLEDPFVAFIGGRLVLGGVRVIREGDRVVSWVTDFYRGKGIGDLQRFATGPDHMKDIRLVELADGRVGVFSRPQGQKVIERWGCIAKIGFAVVRDLDHLTAAEIAAAPFLEGTFLPEEWGGANQAYLLANGLVGVVGHAAWGEQIDGVHVLHYYSMAFAVDPRTRRFTQTKVIAARECFVEGPALQPRLRDVAFTAGIVRLPGGRAELWTGLGDLRIGRIEIEDPLVEYESLEA